VARITRGGKSGDDKWTPDDYARQMLPEAVQYGYYSNKMRGTLFILTGMEVTSGMEL
jgi:hypothetical protein